MCRFESILCESILVYVCVDQACMITLCLYVCIIILGFLYVHICVCVSQCSRWMQAGVFYCWLHWLVPYRLKLDLHSRCLSGCQRHARTHRHTQDRVHCSPLIMLLLLLSVFQPTVYISSPCLHLCVFLCDHERFSLSSTWSVRIIWRSIVDTVHTFHKSLLISLKGKMQHGGMCASLYFIDSWRGLRALWKSLHLLCGDKANCNRPKHEAFMKMVFQLTSLLAVAEHSQSCIQASGAQCVTFL